MLSLLSQAQHMFFHLLPGFGTPFTWVGLGGDANWSTTANWSEGSVPGAAHVANFDDRCVSNCNPTMNVPVNISGIKIKATYAGTITQAAGHMITIGNSGWVQAAGTFNGSDTDINFGTNSLLTLSGSATFNSTTAQMYFDITGATRNVISTTVGVTLTFPNNSTARFRMSGGCGGPMYSIVSPNSISFYNLTTDAHSNGCGQAYFGYASGNYIVRNDYNHISADSIGVSGNFEVHGNIVSSASVDENSTWTAAGNVSKTFAGPGGVGKLIINKTGGATFTPLNAAQTFRVRALDVLVGEYTFPQILNMQWTSATSGVYFKITAGTIVNIPNNSTINIVVHGACGSPSKTIDVDTTFNFENLDMTSYGTGCGGSDVSLAPGDSLTVKKDFSIASGFGANFNITVEGSISTSSPAGSMAITSTNGNSKTISQAAAAITSGLFTVSKPGGTLTANNNLSFNNAGQSMCISNGTVDLAGRNLVVNNAITIGASGKLLCNGGTVTAASWTVTGEVSCGTSVGITWTGLAGDNLWSSAGNWTNNTVPGATDVAIFNGMCAGANCNAQMDSNLSVRGISMMASYTGTLTQNNTRTLTVGTAGFAQAGGIFVGGDSAVTINGPFALSGGTYTATSNTWTQSGNMTVSGAPTFNHNSGTWQTGVTMTMVPNGITMNNVIFAGSGAVQNLSAGLLIAIGSLQLADTVSGTLLNGTVEVRGDVTTTGTGKLGTAVIKINGPGLQTITGTAGYYPSINIDKVAGSVDLVGTLRSQNNWSHTQGTVNAGTSTLLFDGLNVIVPGTMIYNNIYFGGWGATTNLSAGTMQVTGIITVNDVNGGTISSGTIETTNDVNFLAGGRSGNAILKFNGAGAQSLTTTGASAQVPTINIDKATGTLTVTGILNCNYNWTWTQGTADLSASTLIFGNNQTITPGPIIYNHVNFGGWGANQNLNAGTMIIAGTTTFSDVNGGTIFNGTVEARGNISLVGGGKSGTGILKIAGAGAQSLASGSASAYVPIVNIDKAGGTLTMTGIMNSVQNWTHTQGTVDPSTSTLVWGAGQTIIPNTMTFNNVNFGGWGVSQNLNAGTLIALGAVTLADVNTGNVNNGTIEARGNVVISSGGKSGTANLTMNGASSGSLTWTAGAFLTNTITVAKTGGASLLLATNANFSTGGRSFTVTSGIMDLAGYDLSVNNILTIGVGATLRCNGGEFTAGTLSNSGTLNCPGYSTYEFNWTGTSGDSNWTTATNWQGGVVPGASDVVAFQDSTCGANCNANINASRTVRGTRIYSPFTGTITQGAGNTLTVGSRGWAQAAGTFSGGDSAITMNSYLTLTGGAFTATSNVLNLNGNFNTAAGTFNHNSGTLSFNNSAPITVTPGTHQYNHVTFPSVSACTGWTLSGTWDIYGALNLSADGWCGAYRSIDGGIIRAYGNVTTANNGIGGNTSLVISGNAVGQTITGGGGYLPALTINTGGSDVTFAGTIIPVGNYTVTTVGTLTTTGSTLAFASGGAVSITPGTAVYNHVSFDGSGTCRSFNLNGTTMNVGGTTTLSGDGWCGAVRPIDNGTIAAYGNVSVTGSALVGTAAVHFLGTADATLAMGTSSNFPRGHVSINKTGGSKLTLLNNARFNGVATQNLTITAGTFDMAGFNLTVGNNISNGDVLRRGTSPTCGTIVLGGLYTGNAAVCP